MLQSVSVNQRPPGLLQQFEGNSITDTVATVNLPIQPPNPAVCVGNGFVVEITNLVRTAQSWHAEGGARPVRGGGHAHSSLGRAQRWAPGRDGW